MTPTTLKSIMANQNLTNLDLATIADVSERQVRNWLMSEYPIPRAVSILLLSLESGALTQDCLINIVQQELKEHIM